MADNMFLFWGSGSIPCWKAMLVLEEKQLLSKCPQKKISFSQKEHKGEDVLKLNPRGEVPAFRDGNVVVNESSAICLYLEDKFDEQGTKLLPGEVAERAKVYQKVFETENVDKALMSDIVVYYFRNKEEGLDKELLETKYRAARSELDIWNGYLKNSGGYVVGSNFTMADIFFFPYIAFGVRCGLCLDKFPALKIFYDKVVQRPSVKATWPPHWNEGPGDTSMMSSV